MTATSNRLPGLIRHRLPRHSIRGLCLSVGIALLTTTVCRAVIIDTGVMGRFVQIQNNGAASRPLHIGEIEAFAPGVTPTPGAVDNTNDFALTAAGASTESSSHTLPSSDARVIDGIQDGSGSWFVASGVGLQYTVDLGVTRDLASLRFWQRGDQCCQDRLEDFSVRVFADDGGGLPGAEVFSQSYTQTGHFPFSTVSTVASREIRPGGNSVIGAEEVNEGGVRFLHVRNNDTTVSRRLHINEVEAFEVGVPPAGSVLGDANDVALSSLGAIPILGATSNDFRPLDGADNGSGSFITTPALQAEYLLDLGQPRNLDSVRVWQRSDGCCQDRLEDFLFTAYANDNVDPFRAGTVLNSQNHPGQVPTNSFSTFTLPTLNSEFTLRSGDTLVMELDPSVSASDLFSVGFDGDGLGELNIESGVTLDLRMLSGFTLDQTFDILDFGSVNGSFDTILPPSSLPANVMLVTDDLLITGEIQLLSMAIPEPSTFILLGLSLVCLRLRSNSSRRPR